MAVGGSKAIFVPLPKSTAWELGLLNTPKEHDRSQSCGILSPISVHVLQQDIWSWN